MGQQHSIVQQDDNKEHATLPRYSEEFVDGLSFLFNHYITSNETTQRVHRSQYLHEGYKKQFQEDFKNLETEPGKRTQIFMSGSQFEAMSCAYFERGRGKKHIIDQSDIDIMVVDCTNQVDETIICDSWLAHYTLICSGYFKSILFSPQAQNPRLFDRSYHHLHPGFFIIRDKFSGTVISSSDFHAASMVDFPSGLSVHGPALSRMNDPLRAIDIDVLYCIKVSHWPQEAAEWATRERQSGWPSPELISTIVQMGCHVVPIGYPHSSTRELEWRISFSEAEMTLSRNLNSHVHRQVYLLFKTVCKYVVYGTSADVNKEVKLASYFLKTIVFWTLETSDSKIWDKKHCAIGLLKLMERLQSCLNSHCLPNYFIPENNMISHIPYEDIQVLMKKLQETKQNILNAFINLDERIGVAGKTVIPLSITRLCSAVVSCLKREKAEAEIIAKAKLNALAKMAVYWFICSLGCTKISLWDLATPKVMTFLQHHETDSISCSSLEALEKARSGEPQALAFWVRFVELVEHTYDVAILDTVQLKSTQEIPLDAILFVICAGQLVRDDIKEVYEMFADTLKNKN